MASSKTVARRLLPSILSDAVRPSLIILPRTGKDLIDADEQEWLAKEEADRASGKGAGWLYRHTLGYLF